VPGVKRPYHAPVRIEQAAQTRHRILDAAAAAFAAHGWAGTTIASVARAAGVTPQAVHLSVGAKPALLVAAVEHAVAGDQPDLPLAEREPFRTAFAPGATLPDRARAFAAGSRRVYQRAGPLFLVLAQAAPVDAELAARWERARARRFEDCRRLVQLTGPHRPAARRKLTDLLFVYSGPGMYADLTGDRGWTSEAYEAWLTEAVEALLGG
jgi:AcrR family transcriptional regulator